MNLLNEHSTIPRLLRNVVEHIHPENTTFLFHHTQNGWEEISYKQVLDLSLIHI